MSSEMQAGPSRQVFWNRGAKVGTFALTQVFVQALIATSGVIVLRFLSKPDYALYTLAVSALSMLNIFTDFGLSHAVIALGGQRFESPGEVDAIVSAALRVRRILFFGVAAAAALVLPFILAKHGGTPAMIVLIVAIVAAASWLQAGSSIFFGILRLYGKIGRLQVIDLTANSLKIILLLLFALGKLSLPWCLAALIASVTLHYCYSRYSVRAFLGHRQAGEIHYRVLWGFCRPLIASTVFNTISGQVTVWLLSVLASTAAIAEIGALNRFIAISTIFAAVMTSIGMPYFSRVRDERAIRSAALQGGGVILVGAAALMFSCWQWPMAWLFILGPKYSNMQIELRYQVAAICITIAGTYCYSVLASRRVTTGQWKIIPITLAAVILGVLVSPPLNTVSAARFQLFMVTPQLLVQGALLVTYFRRAHLRKTHPVENTVTVF